MTAHSPPPPAPPIGVLVELTHRCPLGCPHCSNPLALERPGAELDTATWARVFAEAAALGALHVHLSGGEPTARRDIAELTRQRLEGRALHQPHHLGRRGQRESCGANWSTRPRPRAALLPGSGQGDQRPARPLRRRLGEEARLRRDGDEGRPAAHPQRGHQPGEPASGRRVHRACARTRREAARDRPHAILRLGAREPRRADAAAQGDGRGDRAGRGGARRGSRAGSSSTWSCPTITPAIRNPAPAAGGGSRSTSRLPARSCPATRPRSIPGLEFWNVRNHSLGEIWRDSPAFRAFRGTDWMREPCRSCDRREIDWGGCRCQALALVGDAAATDPACHKSPHHARIAAIAAAEAKAGEGAIRWRSYKEKVEA